MSRSRLSAPVATEAPLTFSNLRKWSCTDGKISHPVALHWKLTVAFRPTLKIRWKTGRVSTLASVVLSQQPRGDACFFFFPAKTSTYIFIYWPLASPVCQLRHTVEGLDDLVIPDRFIFAKAELELESVRQKNWFMIHQLHKSYLFIMNNTFGGNSGLNTGTGNDA